MNVFETEGLRYNDPYADLQPALHELSIDAAHERATGKGVRVAVIDSLVDDHHPDMRGRVSVRRDLVGNRRSLGRAEVHGTATAGIIASAANNEEGIVGVAPDAEIVSLRACWTVDENTGRARCSSLSLAQALGTALELDIKVINLSLSGPRDPLLERLIDRALAEGAIVVAAWPDSAESGGDFPASHPGVLAAGASGLATRRSVTHSSSDLLRAPGIEVLSTVPGADYAFFSGNSMAAAFITGVAALLVERRPDIDGAAVSALLHETSTAVSIDACRAVAGNECGLLSAETSSLPLAQVREPR
jgi:subtilisin family serine protease